MLAEIFWHILNDAEASVLETFDGFSRATLFSSTKRRKASMKSTVHASEKLKVD